MTRWKGIPLRGPNSHGRLGILKAAKAKAIELAAKTIDGGEGRGLG